MYRITGAMVTTILKTLDTNWEMAFKKKHLEMNISDPKEFAKHSLSLTINFKMC